ncbi:ATP-binding protein [Streptomyces lydicamycinicus]|uniref:ATP-binding protein n=1 Tax=Streptomyces lydicamycinicus TaxID=1546107 RepID=UPI003C2F44E5
MHHFPADVTSFVGRRRQIADTKRLLSETRLVTLTGPGGVGKTRLALHVAAAKRRSFHDGAYFIELAELRDPALLTYAAAEKLGLHTSARPVIDTIIEHLASREVLLVLDNCEHMIGDCALFVDALIRGCPKVRILATSRQSLGLNGETTLSVPPLPVPEPDRALSPDALAQYDSVRLFIDRAKAVLPQFDLRSQDSAVLARLCRDLDGIPLAIELAAVWLRALSLSQIAERLSERYRLLDRGSPAAPTRQRTLRALMDWSYNLCSVPEQQVWARASVFSGAFNLAAVEYVGSGDGVATEEVPHVIFSLVDKSILIREEDTSGVYYRMLETVREYGQECLVAAGEYDATRRRHRDWYADVVDRFEAEFIGPDQDAWIRRLHREHANLRVALDFCMGQPGEAVIALHMATMIDEYWSILGINTEARHWFNLALEASPEPTRQRSSALCLSAWYALLQGDTDAGMQQLAEAAELAERLGGVGSRAFVTLIQGMMALFTGELESAASLLGDALSGFRAKYPRGELFALSQLGLALGLKGDRERGLAYLDECIATAAQVGEVYWRAWALWATAFVEVNHDLERAEAAGIAALEIHGRMGGRLGLAFSIDTLAWVQQRQGRHTQAATLFGAAAATWREIGGSPDYYLPMRTVHHRHASETRAALGADRYEAAFRCGYRLSQREAIDVALGSKAAKTTPRPAEEKTPLTPREWQIAELVTEGLPNKDIAARLVISRRTAETHVDNILTKLEFTSRTQIAAWYTAQKYDPPVAD